MNNRERSSIFAAFLWMGFLSILLCWLPVFGQFIAGFVGGKKAGSAGRAVLAFLVPALILSILLIFELHLLPIVIGPLIVVMISYNFALFCGAVVGGAMA
ncbi:hypothetical protein ACFL6L_03120 [candidate division KSB1 bacterium]